MECHASTLKVLGLFGLTSALVGMFYFLTTLPDLFSRVVGWIGLGFFSLGFVGIPILLFRRGPQVIINDEGFEDRRLKLGVIRWADIRSLSIRSVNSAKFLRIELSDPDKYFSRLPRRSRWLAAATRRLGLPTLTSNLSGLSPGLKEVWAYLQARHGSLTSEPRLEPESRYVVRLSDSEVSCERPDGKVERVRWADLLHRLQDLPGFDHGAVIEAMTSVSNRRFLCWEK